MPSNIHIFQRDLKKMVPTFTGDALVRYQRNFALQAFRLITYQTPKDSGHLRYNVQVSIGAPATKIRPDGGPAPNLPEALQAMARLKPFDIVYVSNPEVYFEVWDEGTFDPPNPGPSGDRRPERFGRILVKGGYSTQAPRGILKPALEKLLEIFGQ